ncbi:MAG: ATPase, T2SS/T4P/T4SS family [bacterium]
MPVVTTEKIDLGRLLVDYKLMTQEQLKEAEKVVEEKNRDIREVLRELNYVNEGGINYVLSSYLDLPYVHISPQIVDPAVVKSIPREILERYRMVPIVCLDHEIELVMADPTDVEAIKEAEGITQCSAKISIGLADEILEVIDQIFGKEVTQISKPPEEILADTSGVAFVYHHLTEAVTEGVSELYIEPTSTQLRILYRMRDGKLEEKKPQPLSMYPGICARLNIMTNIPATGKESNILTRIGDKEVYLHTSVLSSINGDCWTIKILERQKQILKLEELGFQNELIEQIRTIINQPSGVIIVTGPPGSGRTATCYALLSEVRNKRVVTIEEAPSYQNDEFIQLESKADSGLKSAISSGADIIMLENMSQEYVLKQCFDIALAGKLILGQMYHPSCFDTLEQLIKELGSTLLANTLLMLIARKKVAGAEKGVDYLYEVLIFNERLKTFLREGDLKKVKEDAEKSGFRSLSSLLKEKMSAGTKEVF